MPLENENLESNENQTIDTLPLAQTIAGAKILGIAQNGDTNLFNINDIKGDGKGVAVASTNPGSPALSQYYFAKPGVTYLNFKDASGNAISIPTQVEGKQVVEAKLVYNGTSWSAVYTPVEIDVSLNTKTKFIDIQKPQAADFIPLATTVESEQYSVRAKVANGGAPFSNLLIPLRSGVVESVLSERSYSRVIYKQNSLYGGQEYSDIGMGLCYVSNNGFGYPWHAAISLITLASSPRFGKIEIKGSVNPTSYNTFYSDQTMNNYTLGDVIELTFERLFHDYLAVAKNLTKGTQVEFKVSPGNNFSNYIPYNTANPCVYFQSGDFSIYSYEYGTTLLNPDKKIEGDSITCGSGSILEPFRYASKVESKGFNVISGGGADYTASIRLRLNEIKFLKPKVVTLMIGGNDILFGIPTKTWGDNLDLIAYELGLLNIKVVVIYPTARAGAGQLINYIKSSIYLKDLDFIDCNTPTAVSGTTDSLKPEYDSGDALHPNNAGHSKVGEVINAYFD